MDPMDDIQLPTRKCISSVHFQDSLSNKSDRMLKSQVQGNRLTGHSHQFYTDFCCDEKRNNTDLHRNWNDREQLSSTRTTHQEVHRLPRSLKTMAHRYRHTEKEAHLLSEPSELQPLKAMAHRYTGKEAHLLSGPSELQPPESSEVQKFNTGPATKTRIQPIHRNRKS